MSYPIGTVCLIVGSLNNPQNVGKQCTILSERHQHDDGTVEGYGYLVEISGYRREWFALERHLMKIDPDQDFSSESEEDKLDQSRPVETVR